MQNAMIRKTSARELRVLNDREYRFVYEYIRDHNGTRAALEAGYSKNTASVQANKLMKKPRIKSALKYLMTKVARKAEIDAEEALRQLFYAVTRKTTYFFDKDGNLLSPDLLPDEVSSIVDGFKVESITYYDEARGTEVTKQKVEYKLTPHATAREQALKVLGLMIDRKEIQGRVKHIVDWDELHKEPTDEVDIIETTIAEVEEE